MFMYVRQSKKRRLYYRRQILIEFVQILPQKEEWKCLFLGEAGLTEFQALWQTGPPILDIVPAAGGGKLHQFEREGER